MNCKEATKSYEQWLVKRTEVVKADLAYKHEQMSADIFSFMRATFYRWIELWEKDCPDLAKATVVLGVGDLHVENFGTWRDQEGRLVWGINDFDEAFRLPYTNDLVRLATSAHLAISSNDLAIQPADACAAILAGYKAGLKAGSPLVLEENNAWLRSTVMSELRDASKFWGKLTKLRTIKKGIPAKVRKVLVAALPEKRMKYRVVHRIAGLGSLGRQRFAAISELDGGLIAREAKALLPSACVWAYGGDDNRSHYAKVVQQAVRCPDPFLGLRKEWVVRRLAPDCGRVELASMEKDRDAVRLLEAMGRETANVHLGSARAITKVKRDLSRRPKRWLDEAATTMVAALERDWQEWSGVG